MCGLIGYSRNNRKSSIKDGKAFALAGLIAIEHRGRHATGAGWAERKDEENVYYSSLAGPATKVADRLPLSNSMHTLIGHTRHATHGDSANPANRHPVVCEGTVAVHNGVLDNHVELLNLVNVTNPGQVDSFAIPALLANIGLAGAEHPADALALVEGHAAIAWLDAADTNQLHLARLATRPLAIGWTRRGDLVFASTPQILTAWGRAASVRIGEIETIPEGSYLLVEGGVIIEYRAVDIVYPVVARPEDMPGAVPVDWWADFDRTQPPQLDGDGIDWSNLAPRRGWA